MQLNGSLDKNQALKRWLGKKARKSIALSGSGKGLPQEVLRVAACLYR